jgi:hypothetical protein
MDWITDRVAIGNYLEASDAEFLRSRGIQSVLSLDGTLKRADAIRLSLEAVDSVRWVDDEGNDLRISRMAVDSLHGLAASTAPSGLNARRAGR